MSWLGVFDAVTGRWMALKKAVVNGSALTAQRTVTLTDADMEILSAAVAEQLRSGGNADSLHTHSDFVTPALGHNTYGEIARFDSGGAGDKPYITIGKADSNKGLLLAMEKPLGLARIGMHGGLSYCFKYNSDGAQVDGLAGYDKTDGIAFNVVPRVNSHKGIGVQGVTGQTADLIDVKNSTGTTLFSVNANGGLKANLPTSSAGLSAGELWSDNGTVKIV